MTDQENFNFGIAVADLKRERAHLLAEARYYEEVGRAEDAKPVRARAKSVLRQLKAVRANWQAQRLIDKIEAEHAA